MEKTFKNLVLAGIGTLAYSYEKSSSLIEQMVKRGEITVNQGKELNEELKKKVDKGYNKSESSPALTVETLKEALSGMNLATKQDIDEINSRINKLEAK